MDPPNKEQIKAWLKAHNRDRQWLADKLGKALQTINNWLSSAKPIPDTILALIAHLMADDAAAAARRKQQLDPIAQVFSLEVDLPTFRTYSQAAKAHHQTIEEWAIAELNAAAAQNLPLPPPFASRLNETLVPYVLTDLTPDEAEIVRLAQQQAQSAPSDTASGTPHI
jgi:maltooligosyltrehalose synthase